MSVVLIRSLILYMLVIFAVRLMGKRQLGELQPSELVITILVSNIATLPLEDVNIPLIVGITPILALVCFEVMISWLNLISPKLRKIISGSAKVIISEGNIDSETMRELRFSVDDLTMALRGQGIFDLSEVQFAVVETTGNISVMKKQNNDTPTRSDTGIFSNNADPPHVIISDGVLLDTTINVLSLSKSELQKTLKQHELKYSDIFIMTADKERNYFISLKNGTTFTMKGADSK